MVNEAAGEMVELEPIHLTSSNDGSYDEAWIQCLIHKSPSLLPVEEIEPVFSGMVPLCMELPTSVGPVDNVFINERGLLTIVECKLWRNSEARRKVVGQILDYAQQISRWSCEDFDRALTRAGAESLWNTARRAFALTDEAAFLDRVQHHLNNGNFLLLIVGDGIRRNTEEITTFMNSHARMSFTLGLVEMTLFRMMPFRSLLVLPRILAKTVEIGRLVVKAGTGVEVEQEDLGGRDDRAGKRARRTLTEDIFIQEVAGNSELAGDIRKFFETLRQEGFGMVYQPSGKSLKIVTRQSGMNLFSLNTDGTIRNHGCGDKDTGKAYLKALCQILPDTMLDDRGTDNGWSWTVCRSNGELLHIEELIRHQQDWLQLIRKVDAEEQSGD